MCHIFAGQDPANYQNVTRSIRLAGHATSVRLESRFWEIIDLIADEQGLSTPQLLSKIYDEALELHGEVSNFASLLRCACTLYLEQPTHVIAEANAEMARAV
jgi:predicted DNA-binding ribbon-helix-helix protein